MKKRCSILLIGTRIKGNLGGPSLLFSTEKVLRSYIPDASIMFFPIPPEDDIKKIEIYGFKPIKYTHKKLYLSFLLSLMTFMLKKLGISISKITKKHSLLRVFLDADIVIDINGISFTDYFPGKKNYFLQSIRLLIGILLGKPVGKFTQDMGPFNNFWNRLFAKITLKHLKFILVRSEKTKKYVMNLGINKDIHVYPDTAFILPAVSSNEINRILTQEGINNQSFVVLVPSRQVDVRISRKENKDISELNNYVLTVARVADYMIEKYGILIVFIPNERSSQKDGYDDLYVSKKIVSAMENKQSTKILINSYSAPQIKGIISKAELVVSSRYHSTIAALSLSVPCFVIGWGFKYLEVMKLFNLEKYVCNFESLELDKIIELIEYIWQNRTQIQKHIRNFLPTIEEKIMSTGKYIITAINN